MNSTLQALIKTIDSSYFHVHDRANLILTILGLKPNSEAELFTNNTYDITELKAEFINLLNKTGLYYKEFVFPEDIDNPRTWNCAYGTKKEEVELLISYATSNIAFDTIRFGVLFGYPHSAANQFQNNPYYLTAPIVKDMIHKLEHILPIRLSLDEATARKEVEELKPWVIALKTHAPISYAELYLNWEEYCNS